MGHEQNHAPHNQKVWIMPKIVDHEKYRAELLARSFDIIAERGAEALSMRDLALALQVSTGTLYHYFPSKQDLVDQLVESMPHQQVRELATSLPSEVTFEARLRLIFQFFASTEPTFRKQLLVQIEYALHHHEQPARLQTVALRYRQLMKTMLNTEDDTIVTLVLSQVLGLVLLRFFEQTTTPLETLIDFLVQTVSRAAQSR
jgi:AcrR family transcriptional regulator